MKKIIDYNAGNLDIHLSLENKVCLLYGLESGTGKTLLFGTLSKVTYEDWSRKYRYIDYSNYNYAMSIVSDILSDEDSVIVCDNVDLYYEICSNIMNTAKGFVILIGRYLMNTHPTEDCGVYNIKVDTSGDRYKLVVEKVKI